MQVSNAKRFLRIFGVVASTLLIAVYYSPALCRVRELPERIRVQQGDSVTLPAARVALFSGEETVTVSGGMDDRLLTAAGGKIAYRLFGSIPLRTVEVISTERAALIPGGVAVGITIHTKGVLVVGLGVVDTAEGALSPGSAAGLQSGDVILSANGVAIDGAEQLMELTGEGGGALTLLVERAGEQRELTLKSVRDARDGAYRMGLWVRDSTAGVGTLSFVDEATGWFAALGHPVSDIDTQSLLPVREGRIVPTEIVDVKTGEQGTPGELIGVFSSVGAGLGSIKLNSPYGIFGQMEQDYRSALYESMPMGYCGEAHIGKAELLVTVSRDGVIAYDCEIVRVNPQTTAATKGMIVDVTDQRLLDATGGIVQGMSGCPVIQDGKLIGVVTHVFVNDPTRGYCVYAEWMLEQIRSAAS